MIRTALFLMAVSALGCAGSQPVRLQLTPGARIGILNVLEPQMTHVDVGSFRLNSFTKLYNVDWDIPGYISRAIENDLRARGSYTFIPLADNAPASWKQSMSSGVLSAINAWMPGNLKSFLKQAAEDNRLDVIISVSSYDSGMWQQNDCFKIGKGEVATKGYGLFTRTKSLSGLSSLLPAGQDTAASYADIIVAVFQTPTGDPGRPRVGALQQFILGGLPLEERPAVSPPDGDPADQALRRTAGRRGRPGRSRERGAAALKVIRICSRLLN